MSNSIPSNRSALKEFIASISTISGDLSNITAPPFLLAEHSTTELPQYWADHPELFVAPAFEDDPAKRALLVLKWFLGSLRNQQYAGRTEDEGIKKPLNAFLGELFLGSFNVDSIGETRLVSEQVRHHPPVTACYLWNEQCGVHAEGFTCQEITFSGSVSIKQKGYAILHIDKYDEDHLIPLPNVKVKGVLSGGTYSELVGSYHLISSSGFISEINFEGKGFLGSGSKNGVEAKVFNVNGPNSALYTVTGQWTGELAFRDATANEEVEIYNVTNEQPVHVQLPEVSKQDPWESRRAWGGVSDALRRSDMQGVSNEKRKIEQGQRDLREKEKINGQEWRPIFFDRANQDPLYEKLSRIFETTAGSTFPGGVWRINHNAVKSVHKPFHHGLVPDNTKPMNDHTRVANTELKTNREHDVNDNNATLRSDLTGNTTSETADPNAMAEIERAQVEEYLRHQYSSASSKNRK